MASDGTLHSLVNYTSRDYESLLEEFKELVPTLTELWKPEADADPGMVLAMYIASVADILGINTDWLANEMFAPSVTQRKNAEKIFGLIGYELGFYTAATTEVQFTNASETETLKLDFGFNGANFCTLNAYTDITGTSRVLTYNILPLTNKYGATESRSRRSVLTENLNVFTDTDMVTLEPGESVTRVAVEGELRSYSVSVESIKNNNYIIKLPSQHLDTSWIWVKAKASLSDDDYLGTQWIQCTSPAEFVEPEPRFAVTYDSYSNAQIQISNYLNELENYNGNYLIIYWIDCSGTIGCVGTNVLTNLLFAKTGQDVDSDSGELGISNLSNTLELPNTYTVTGNSPETAREAYINSRNYINTFDSLVTLPDFNRFLNREAGIDCGLVIDCQKALEINMAIYKDENLTTSQKSKQYITNYDFPEGSADYNWESVLGLDFDPSDPQKYVFATNFKTYTAMCFAIHNDFEDSSWGEGQTATAQISKSTKFTRYKPPELLIDAIDRDYRPLQAMSVELQWGYLRIFDFYTVGTITPTKPVSTDVANTIISIVKEALALYFAPANREIGVMPTLIEIVDVIENADSRIRHYDPGSPGTANYGIVFSGCDIDYFNAISFARYNDSKASDNNIRINPIYILD
ncbi:MAG: hypothetical protein LUC17_01310 [Oscillospiraceae bacterium]|nr:hypothetical protein [Oscillospiraceae bacterium]